METVYAVRISEDGKPPEPKFRGTWADCKKFAYDYMVQFAARRLKPQNIIRREIQNLNRMQGAYNLGELHIQGDASKPGYVGYGHPDGKWHQYLWVLISDANPPPEPEREPFDKDAYGDYILSWAKGIYGDLGLPDNADLRELVSVFNSEGGFMFGFRSKRNYDNGDAEFPLTDEQDIRWDTITNAHDTGGGTGAQFGMAARLVQSWLTGVRPYGE